MREIKFRAWLKNRKVMGKVLTIHFEKETTVYAMDDGVGRTWFKKDNENAVIMQYTGLKDKNGKEIYEGDIVRCVSELFSNFGRFATGRFATEYYEICSLDGDYSYCFGTKKIGKEYISKDILKSNAESFYEVIGNIYENSELL